MTFLCYLFRRLHAWLYLPLCQDRVSVIVTYRDVGESYVSTIRPDVHCSFHLGLSVRNSTPPQNTVPAGIVPAPPENSGIEPRFHQRPVSQSWIIMVPPAGLEPATRGLEVHCSIHLSYGGSLGSSMEN